ncbi:MAG TPA: UDP-N-acetylmuramate dehydrogenase [Jatrophihabitans sp.]|nr:UDP-N-acetylmuramate dehydrogenase [Jatrophihabitans sp.]
MTPAFAELTTIHVGGPTRDFAVATDTKQLVELVRDADANGVPLLVMSGGSNLVVGDGGWDGLTVKVASTELRIDGPAVEADAGVDWDDLVRLTLEHGLGGFEQMSGIPGSVGGTPVQNVGAFGAVTSDLLCSVTVYNRDTQAVEEWPAARCGFGSHRDSVFKRCDRYVILRVSYRLRPTAQSNPLGYEALVARLGIEPGGTAGTGDVRRAVLELRRERGSIYDPADHDTWGTGSFFANPVLAEVPQPASAAGVPQYPDPKGTKLAAAWLIHRSGFPPGYGADFGRGSVRLSSKHALAVSNRGEATTAEVMAFARHIREGVEARFGVRLTTECDLVNCSLDAALLP